MKAIVLRPDLIKGRLLVYFNDGTIASRTDGMGSDKRGRLGTATENDVKVAISE